MVNQLLVLDPVRLRRLRPQPPLAVRLIVAVCSREMQIARAMKRDGLTREEVLARLERQLPLEEKVKVADYVIDTSGTKEHAFEQTREVYRSLRSLQP